MRQFRVLAVLSLTVTLLPLAPAEAATIVATYGVGKEPMGIAVDSTDGRLYVANSQAVSGPGSVSVITPGSRLVGTIQTSAASDFVAVDAANHHLYSSNLDRTVQVFDLTTFA